MADTYDSKDMQKVLNNVNTAIAEIDTAIKKLNEQAGTPLGKLSGAAKTALQSQINDQKQALQSNRTTLIAARDALNAKIKVML